MGGAWGGWAGTLQRVSGKGESFRWPFTGQRDRVLCLASMTGSPNQFSQAPRAVGGARVSMRARALGLLVLIFWAVSAADSPWAAPPSDDSALNQAQRLLADYRKVIVLVDDDGL
jgi:hypothetical protein